MENDVTRSRRANASEAAVYGHFEERVKKPGYAWRVL